MNQMLILEDSELQITLAFMTAVFVHFSLRWARKHREALQWITRRPPHSSLSHYIAAALLLLMVSILTASRQVGSSFRIPYEHQCSWTTPAIAESWVSWEADSKMKISTQVLNEGAVLGTMPRKGREEKKAIWVENGLWCNLNRLFISLQFCKFCCLKVFVKTNCISDIK